MTTIEAIKKYFGTERPVENKELLELKKALPQKDWEDMGKECAKALGETWTER